ncbi:GNAT family N-acetyltransferase [archaeon]|nr:GNAT family N-acetyltransferase [archaeon]MBL7057164.1 GNAT family N-acetyltransferase [Candidatus Woesearchaeota archaeon]
MAEKWYLDQETIEDTIKPLLKPLSTLANNRGLTLEQVARGVVLQSQCKPTTRKLTGTFFVVNKNLADVAAQIQQEARVFDYHQIAIPYNLKEESEKALIEACAAAGYELAEDMPTATILTKQLTGAAESKETNGVNFYLIGKEGAITKTVSKPEWRNPGEDVAGKARMTFSGDRNVVYLDGVEVFEGHQRQGFASALVNDRLKEAETSGAKLAVTIANDQGIKIYNKRGDFQSKTGIMYFRKSR